MRGFRGAALALVCEELDGDKGLDGEGGEGACGESVVFTALELLCDRLWLTSLSTAFVERLSFCCGRTRRLLGVRRIVCYRGQR